MPYFYAELLKCLPMLGGSDWDPTNLGMEAKL